MTPNPANNAKEFSELLEEIKRIQNLLILIASKSGAKSDEIGKVFGIEGGSVRKVLAGIGVTKKKKR